MGHAKVDIAVPLQCWLSELTTADLKNQGGSIPPRKKHVVACAAGNAGLVDVVWGGGVLCRLWDKVSTCSRDPARQARGPMRWSMGISHHLRVGQLNPPQPITRSCTWGCARGALLESRCSDQAPLCLDHRHTPIDPPTAHQPRLAARIRPITERPEFHSAVEGQPCGLPSCRCPGIPCHALFVSSSHPHRPRGIPFIKLERGNSSNLCHPILSCLSLSPFHHPSHTLKPAGSSLSHPIRHHV